MPAGAPPHGGTGSKTGGDRLLPLPFLSILEAGVHSLQSLLQLCELIVRKELSNLQSDGSSQLYHVLFCQFNLVESDPELFR